MHRSTLPRSRPFPGQIVGYRRDGRPVRVIAGGSGDDPTPTPSSPAAPPVPAPPARTFSQDEASALAAKEKREGKRLGETALAATLGFEDPDKLRAFIEAAKSREAEQLTETERREKELAAREQAAAEREATATALLRDTVRKAALVSLGASGDDLEDALVILGRDLAATPDADQDAVTAAATALKARRPAFFGAPAPASPPSAMPPAPGGAPAALPPNQLPTAGKPGSRGLEMARRRGHLKEAS